MEKKFNTELLFIFYFFIPRASEWDIKYCIHLHRMWNIIVQGAESSSNLTCVNIPFYVLKYRNVFAAIQSPLT